MREGLPGDDEARPTEEQYATASTFLWVVAGATTVFGLVGWGLRGWPFLVVAAAFAFGALVCARAAHKAADGEP